MRADNRWQLKWSEHQGNMALAKYLAGINSRRNRSGVDTEMELEILKCFKVAFSHQVGHASSQLTIARYARCVREADHYRAHWPIPHFSRSAMSQTRSRIPHLFRFPRPAG